MCISLFYKLHHSLAHGFISNTTQSVPIVRYCLPYRLCCAWQKEYVVCLVSKSKPVHCMITGYEYYDL